MCQYLSRSAMAVALVLASADLPAQTPPLEPPVIATPSDVVPAAVEPATLKLAALTAVELQVLDEISSKTAVAGSPVRLALTRPLYISEELGLPAGTPVEGVVIHAAKGGFGGKSGELLLAAKRIMLPDGSSIPLRSFKLALARGKNNEGIVMGMVVAGGAIGGVASMFIVGGSAVVPAGAHAFAKTSADIEVAATLLATLPVVQKTMILPAATPAPPAAQRAAQAGPATPAIDLSSNPKGN